MQIVFFLVGSLPFADREHCSCKTLAMKLLHEKLNINRSSIRYREV